MLSNPSTASTTCRSEVDDDVDGRMLAARSKATVCEECGCLLVVGRAVVGEVEACTFENQTRAAGDDAHHQTAALRALFHRQISDSLEFFKFVFAGLTSI
jgi:hypothetical protein